MPGKTRFSPIHVIEQYHSDFALSFGRNYLNFNMVNISFDCFVCIMNGYQSGS